MMIMMMTMTMKVDDDGADDDYDEGPVSVGILLQGINCTRQPLTP